MQVHVALNMFKAIKRHLRDGNLDRHLESGTEHSTMTEFGLWFVPILQGITLLSQL